MSIMNSEQKHFFVRVGDGKNFINSKHPIWGLKSNGGAIKTLIKNQMNLHICINLRNYDVVRFIR